MYRGEPVPAGNVIFTPDSSQGNTGPGSVAEINEGNYETPEGKGIVGGPHRVVIFGFPAHSDEIGLFQTYSTTVEFPHEDSTYDFDVSEAKPVLAGAGRR